MDLVLANTNAVVVARHFNPSIINHLWLVENELVDRDGFRAGCVFTDMLSQVNTADYSLLAAPEQLQFTPNAQDDQRLVREVLGKIVRTLPHTPYTAAGLNFAWQVRSETQTVAKLSRALFFRSDQPLFEGFDCEEARFGGYLSRDALGCRLKLDVKPISARSEQESVEFLQFAFNFHQDVDQATNAVEQILGLLDRWPDALDMTKEIMSTVQRGK